MSCVSLFDGAIWKNICCNIVGIATYTLQKSYIVIFVLHNPDIVDCHWQPKSWLSSWQPIWRPDTLYWHLRPIFKWVVVTPWASCQIRKMAGAHASGMPGTFSPSPQVDDPDMHHGTCVTHVPWCMPGSLTSGFLWNRWRGETFPAFPAHAQPAILRIW